MSLKIGRNSPCPCGSGKKYKKCCMQHIEESPKGSEPWMDEEGMHILGKGASPSPEEQERMTNEYQKKIKKSPMWEMMVREYGEEKAEVMLKEFQVQVK
ncbi:MAG: SEC-C metal-binding domain-containing protein [Pseudomonadota bacterium]